MSTFRLRLPDDLEMQAAAQAESLGISLHRYIILALAARIGEKAETAGYLAICGRRALRGTAKQNHRSVALSH